MEEFGDFGLWKIDAKIESGGSTMLFGEELVWYNEVAAGQSMVSKVAIPSSKFGGAII
jgi:hypothetical protein